ncbi:unnamed protein product [Cyprideis torosa]|uniref:Uncharacterized protein n=1 Tax=Cyprideis torosa TaxID=163714 RepID=A0A7R8W7E0_9CRUS|nr:unnamed protein product [Cyprideis torosa]CAG0883142.1 unnamed protein product [Cyprideis torosa]
MPPRILPAASGKKTFFVQALDALGFVGSKMTINFGSLVIYFPRLAVQDGVLSLVVSSLQGLKGRGELQRNHERIFGQPVVAELANIPHVLCVHRDSYKNQHGCVLLYNRCESYNTV